jgi:predicted transcriptional regulator
MASFTNDRQQVRAELVKTFREKKGQSQAQAASWWGCSERQWRRYETGESPVPRPLLKRIKKSTFPGE